MEKYNKETMAKVEGRSLPISTKQAIEISNFIRRKKVQKAKIYLEAVLNMKKAIPFTRFNKGVGHKPGIGPGRYPINASKNVLMLLNSAEANAQFKGLNTSNLVISHINADKASCAWHYGRQRRREMKRTNMTIILSEGKQIKKEAKEAKPEEKGKISEERSKNKK